MAAEEQRLADRLSELGKKARRWGTLTRKQMLRRLAELGLHDRVQVSKEVTRLRIVRSSSGKASLKKEEFLMRSVRSGIRYQHGALDKVWFSFERHGIFLEHGVGKGRPVRSTQALAAAKPWLSVILPHRIEELAEILSDEYADIAAEELRILIPGIIDTKITTR